MSISTQFRLLEVVNMALVTCPECGKENVSDSAVSCPECGYAIKNHFDEIRLDLV